MRKPLKMGLSITNYPRVPISTAADAAALAAKTGMSEGDLCYQDDTNELYSYDGAAWNNVLAGVTQDCTLIESQTLGADATTITFSTGLSSTYKSYLLVVEADAVVTAGDAKIGIRFNADTGNNYGNSQIRGSTGGGYSGTTPFIRTNGAAISCANGEPMHLIATIGNLTAMEKPVQLTAWLDDDTISGCSNWVNSANAITTIALSADEFTGTNKFASGSRASLWGFS